MPGATRSGERGDRPTRDRHPALATAVLGFLELGLGRVEAITALEALATFLGRRPAGDREVLQWGPALIEAYVRAGRRTDAGAALRGFADAARYSEGRWALSATARCRGLLAEDRAFEPHFRDALQLHNNPFETAARSCVFGERLRRAGRRVEARQSLHAALGTFDRLGGARGRRGPAASSASPANDPTASGPRPSS